MHDDETIRHRAQKDKKRWCRGKEGVEHQVAIVYRPWRSNPEEECRWYCWFYGGGIVDCQGDHSSGARVIHHYRCGHVARCTECGRIMSRTVECPDKV